MNNIKLSVALATYNEEKCIKDCLNSIKDIAEEIVVVDGSSVDKTVEIAKSFGAKVIITENKPVFHINKQLAIDECKGEWILLLDADEVVPSNLAQEIETITQQLTPNTYNAYFLKRKKMFLGRWMRKGGQYPDPVIRFFKKSKAYLPCKSVHEQMEVEGKTGILNNELVHIPNQNFSVYITKDNRYSSLTAQELAERKVKINFISGFSYIYWKPLCVFFNIYIRHLGILDGFPGFVFALYSGLHIRSAYIKYWEGVHTKNNDLKKYWV